jgi:cbb3-type cytochrome oxidase subunit 3
MTDKTQKLNETTIAFLNQECDRMLALYQQAQANAQSVFNFYLTFVTAVLGAVVFILQVAPSDSETGHTSAMLVVVLFFAAIVGSIYLPALSGRYAHAARYSLAVDEIRRHLIAHLESPLPSIYQSLTQPLHRQPGKALSWLYWLMPSGTYEMFITFVNSAALGAIVWVFADLAGVSGGRVVFAAGLVFVLSTIIYNVYSHLIIARFGKGVNVHLWDDSPGWAARN